MPIRLVETPDAAEWLRLRMALWPDTDREDEQAEIIAFLTGRKSTLMPEAVFVVQRPDIGLGGMIEVGIRPYADGCDTENVGYLEAWYVDPDLRGQGLGRALVQAAETWALEQGCREMASDAELANVQSQSAHRSLGYEEVGRIVQYRKPIGPGW